MIHCKKCGASLPVPEDLSVLSVTCSYCGTRQLLPDADARRDRAEQERDDRGDRLMWNAIRAGTVLFVLAVLAFVGWRVLTTLAASPAAPAIAPAPPLPAPMQVAQPEPPKPEPPAEPPGTGEERMTELLQGRAADGCRRVLLPPRVTAGSRELTATLVRGPRCVELFVVSGSEGEALTVTLKSPLGERIAAPEPASEVFIRHCPTVAGPHPITVASSTGHPYTVAGVECPRRRGD